MKKFCHLEVQGLMNAILPVGPERTLQELSRYHSIVRKDLRVFFCAVPKAACTTVKRAFMAMDGEVRPYLFDVHKPENNNFTRLFDLDEAEVSAVENADGWTTAISVRDPLTRVISAYKSKIVSQSLRKKHLWQLGLPKADLESGRLPSFDEFIDLVCAADDEALDAHYRTQCGVAMFDRFKYREIIKVEQMPDALIAFFEGVGCLDETVKSVAGVKHNRTGGQIDKATISRETLRKVRDKYECDYEAFGYADPLS